ncbi:unnamed protein product [Kuraishia capsulata CBS 1993]|uniref:Uncharacterized protein n=1 Tax=Kuraishia capsulata CBS 1993 TaxID=1382522 RepID=W6MG41_9ASCO|nr:uncharacterized protein KUCA_T00000652001 [Kuraishia capsulata CBS 1993]CDK24686.1 unnamed protein product [Kuraishia capsulata CBS 1993]
MTYPISYDSTTKKVTLDDDVSASQYKDLQVELSQLNTLTSELVSNGGDVPPAPSKESYNKSLSAMTKKMHEAAVSSMKTQKFADAAKQFGLALEMASRRAKFESFQLTIPEVAVCLNGRCDANLMAGNFLDAYNDAEILTNIMPNVPDHFLRKGVAARNLGRLVDAKAEFERGLCFNESHPKLQAELQNIVVKIAEENGE